MANYDPGSNAGQALSLMAHLMRRAGFGATREELERRIAAGYEATVEDLLHPEAQEPVDIYKFLRYYHFQWKPGTLGGIGQSGWVWRMINTNAPLQEKMCLFWHQIFATGVSKVDHYDEITDMIDIFRDKGFGKYRDLLLEVSRNPAMLFWLDNHENHATAINENWGRELLELFTMGVGNYTEEDVYECSRAFTGWTMTPKLPRFHMGRWDWYFEYRPDDHDEGEKNFLGHKGNFNGEDIIDIVLAHPATAHVHRTPPVQLLRRRRGAGARMAGDPAARPCRNRGHSQRAYRVRVRHPPHAACAVQLRLLQGRPVHQGKEPDRGGHRHAQDVRRR